MSEEEKYFFVPHINIRQSIFVLILRLIVIELFFFLVFYSLAFPYSFLSVFFNFIPSGFSVRIGLFLLALLAKIYFEFMVVYQWLSEYYEITKTRLIHRKGFIFRKEQSFDFKQVRLADIRQGFLGKFLNYGTIHLFDPYAKKNIYIYQIHNPTRYYHMIKKLIPMMEDEREIVSLHKIPED